MEVVAGGNARLMGWGQWRWFRVVNGELTLSLSGLVFPQK